RLKLVRVRVEASKKRLTITLPVRSVRFLRRFWLRSTKVSAVSRIVRISAAEGCSRPRRWRCVQGTVADSAVASSSGMRSSISIALHSILHDRVVGDPRAVIIGLGDKDLVAAEIKPPAESLGQSGGALGTGDGEQRRSPGTLPGAGHALSANELNDGLGLRMRVDPALPRAERLTDAAIEVVERFAKGRQVAFDDGRQHAQEHQ